MDEVRPIQRRNGDGEGLTGIHARIHCAATPDTTEEYSETDMIIVNNFLNPKSTEGMTMQQRNGR